MPPQDAFETLAAAQARAKTFKAANKKTDQAKKLLGQLAKAQTASKAAKKELDGETDE